LILEGKPVVKFKSNIKHFAALHSIRFNEQRLFISRKAACRAIASVTAGQDRKEKKNESLLESLTSLRLCVRILFYPPSTVTGVLNNRFGLFTERIVCHFGP
jgi:hypothetical protein